jgi:hypothetical protein
MRKKQKINVIKALNDSKLDAIWREIGRKSDCLNPHDRHVVRGIEMAKNHFPALIGKSNEFVLNFLEEASFFRQEVYRGKYLSGVFCDVEAVLFTGDALNEAVFNFLQQKENEGKEIVLLSDGNLLELQLSLDIVNITYELRPKREIAGAIVEMVIDHMDEHSFSAFTKIYAHEFVEARNIA